MDGRRVIVEAGRRVGITLCIKPTNGQLFYRSGEGCAIAVDRAQGLGPTLVNQSQLG